MIYNYYIAVVAVVCFSAIIVFVRIGIAFITDIFTIENDIPDKFAIALLITL